MSNLFWLCFAIAFSVLFSFHRYMQFRMERAYIPKDKNSLYPVRWGLFFPLVMPVVLLFNGYYDDEWFSLFIVRILMLTGCLGLLLLLLPALRKVLYAESCASLWVIPSFLFVFAGIMPRWSILLPFSYPSEQVLHGLFWVWLTGFAAVMLWSILSHLRFRRHLLKEAEPVEDEAWQQAWQWQVNIANLPKGLIRLYVSENTQTPLSIGLSLRTTCLVLPKQAYSDAELAWIFQHELIHISRRDSFMKFSMTFCAACMWFHPLAWIALRVCAQDLELSCDEAVLYGRPEKAEYARLLLQTATGQQGFTTCLSTSAASLRYRLKSILTQRKRIVGSVIMGILCFALVLAGMCTGVRYRAMPAGELLFTPSEKGHLDVVDVMVLRNGVDINIGYTGGVYKNEPLLLDYVQSLSLQQTTEEPDIYAAATHIQMTVRSSGHTYVLSFGGHYLRVSTRTFSSPAGTLLVKTAFYYLDSEPDWKLLISCVQ